MAKFKGERTKSTLIIITGLILFLIPVFFNFAPAIAVIVALISSLAVFELIKAVGAESKVLFTLAIVATVLQVGIYSFDLDIAPALYIPVYVLIMLCVTVGLNSKIKYQHTVMAVFASLCVPYSLSCFVMLNNAEKINPGFNHLCGVFFVFMAFSCSWVCDSFAFLVGRKFGKHKMTPVISPKKSIEGAVFGILLTAIFNMLILLGFELVSKKAMGYDYFITTSPLKFVLVPVFSIVLCIVGIFGDLAASVLKRNVGIKDYSNLLPGHGGIMDRFDSTLFVLPTMLFIIRMFSM